MAVNFNVEQDSRRAVRFWSEYVSLLNFLVANAAAIGFEFVLHSIVLA